MRGKRAQFFLSLLHIRNIPAYAGKTGLEPRTHWLRSEHPRVCGENVRLRLCSGLLRGTSPRMRENPPTAFWKTTPIGTSPRMRGKQMREVNKAAGERNIPAYAGKTVGLVTIMHAGGEHPRVCGENFQVPPVAAAGSGTSPRMLGKPMRNTSPNREERNIPAYAGKTWRYCYHVMIAAEHPRVCGENLSYRDFRAGDAGTSPRMRGKRASATCIRGGMRNIPAYAGKTKNLESVRVSQKEHPRVCGENLLSA